MFSIGCCSVAGDQRHVLCEKNCCHVLEHIVTVVYTAWKVSKYGVFSGPYFPVFIPNTGKYGPEKNPYLDTFHVVLFPYYVIYNAQKRYSCRGNLVKYDRAFLRKPLMTFSLEKSSIIDDSHGPTYFFEIRDNISNCDRDDTCVIPSSEIQAK